MSLSLTTAPTVEPLTVAEVLAHARVDHHGEDELIATLITAARQAVERHTSRALINQTWTLKLDAFPFGDQLELPKAPLVSVTSLVYVDSNGDSQTWAGSNYVVDAPAGPNPLAGTLSLAYGVAWPTARGQRHAVTVKFVAGYGATAATVPADIRQAMLLMIGELYARREEVVIGANTVDVTLGSERLLASYVVGSW